MTTAEQQTPLPFYEQGLPHLDRYQRIEVLAEIEGFLPVSKPEQTEVIGLESVIAKPHGTSKHLAEVALRSKNYKMEDVSRASRRIVRNYVDWALDAQTTSRQLDVLADEMADINPELSLSEPDLAHDIGRIGLLKFLRFYDLAQLRDLGDVERLPYDPQRVNYSEDNGGIMAHLEMALASWRVGQVKRKLPLAQQDSSNRFLFWVPRLVEVTRHSTGNIKAIAQEGLDKIYGRTE